MKVYSRQYAHVKKNLKHGSHENLLVYSIFLSIITNVYETIMMLIPWVKVQNSEF